MKIACDKVTRFEVIDEFGRAYVRNGIICDLHFQDDGRTLKAWIGAADPAEKPKFETVRCQIQWHASLGHLDAYGQIDRFESLGHFGTEEESWQALLDAGCKRDGPTFWKGKDCHGYSVRTLQEMPW
jgi:hypothetical protein